MVIHGHRSNIRLLECRELSTEVLICALLLGYADKFVCDFSNAGECSCGNGL
jgi:hypothetical protein